jgi:hypothetical protein
MVHPHPVEGTAARDELTVRLRVVTVASRLISARLQ